MGEFLGDEEAKNIGINYAERGISQQDAKGYYYEKGGWDSSYQGVGTLNAFQLVLAINNSETIHASIWN
ncbi:MAG: hypothetical protein MK078_01255 [Crocinitomicaceae bacterium]|nr:hypothetical protein [Crocinitomicaceae bacterium]